jgi:hypothetical protein
VLPLEPLFSDPFGGPRERVLDYGAVLIEDPSDPDRYTEGRLTLRAVRPLAMPVPETE